MPFIGVQPASALLTSADIQDGQITTAKVADDAIGNTKLDLTANYAFTGTVSGTVSGTGAFSARSDVSVWATVADEGILAFDNDSSGDSFDTDSNYNTSTYKYTAPATGVYLFWFAVYTHNTDTSNGFGFLKNSAKVDFQRSSARHFAIAYTDDEHSETATIVIPLTSGDTMAVCATLTDSEYYRAHSQWGGCRLA